MEEIVKTMRLSKLISWVKCFLGLIGVIALILFVIFKLPNILLEPNNLGVVYENTGQIGDTLGGLTAPFIGGIGIIFTFLAFYMQYAANRQQERDLKVERFESKFFELINIHRGNVSEISIHNGMFTSRKAIMEMFREFELCYSYIFEKKEEHKSFVLKEEDLVNISFILFYIGIGIRSKPMLLELLSKYDLDFIELLIKHLDSEPKRYKNGKYGIIMPKVKGRDGILSIYLYKPFQGHITELGHYLRHIWTTINYLESQNERIIKEKYSYAKMLRAQLSSYEQLLLHYNALTSLGSAWGLLIESEEGFEFNYFSEDKSNEGLLRKYKLTKNLLYPVAHFGPDLVKLYGKKYFEWSEVLKNEIS